MKQATTKRLHFINSLFYTEGDVNLTGLDEFGKEFSITISIFEVLEWVNTTELKEEAIKYINEI